MNKHTPGPWKGMLLNADGSVVMRSGYEISTPDYDVVAYIHRGAPIRKEEDARLIAAAPELYEACKSALVPLDLWPETLSEDLAAIRDELRAALAKAGRVEA